MKILCLLLFTLFAFTLFAQKNFIHVTEVRGKVKIIKSDGKESPLIAGKKLYDGSISLDKESHVILCSNSQRIIKIDKEGTFSIKDVLNAALNLQETGFLQNLYDFMKENVKTKRSVQGSIATLEGAVKRSSASYIPFDFPSETSLLRTDYNIQLKNQRGDLYKCFISFLSDSILVGESNSTSIEVSFKNILPDIDNIEIFLQNDHNIRSRNKNISFFDVEDEKLIINKVNEIKTLANSYSEKDLHLMLGSFYESYNLVYDAYLEYLKAIELEPGDTKTNQMFKRFTENYQIISADNINHKN